MRISSLAASTVAASPFSDNSYLPPADGCDSANADADGIPDMPVCPRCGHELTRHWTGLTVCEFDCPVVAKVSAKTKV